MDRELTVREAAQSLGVSGEIIRRAIRSGILLARPRGTGPRSGLLVSIDSLELWARSKGNAPGGWVKASESRPAQFVEDAPLFPGLPTPKLPPVRGTVRDLLAYVETCQTLGAAALSAARRRMEEGDVDVI